MHMRKRVTKFLAVVVITIMSFSFVVSAQFPDIPSDHWAYDAVAKLVDEGLITGMPDGNYHGSEPMNRYAVAVLVAKVLDRIEQQPATVVERIIQQPVTVNQPVQPIIEKTIVDRVVQEPVEVTKIVEKEYIEKPVEKIIEKHIVHELVGLKEDEVKAIIGEYAEKLAALERKAEDTDIKIDEEITLLGKRIESNKKLSENLFVLFELFYEENGNELKAMDQRLSSEINNLDIKFDEETTLLGKRIESNKALSENIFTLFDMYVVETDKDLEEVNAKVNTLLENVETAESKAITYTDSKIEESNAKIANVQEDLEKKYVTINRVNDMQTKLDEQNDKIIKMEKDLKSTRTIAILGLLAGIAGIIVGFVI